MNLKARMVCKEPRLNPQEYYVAAIEVISGSEFSTLLHTLLHDKEIVKRNNPNLNAAILEGKEYTALLILNADNDDGLLVDSQGADYCRYTSYMAGIRPYVEKEITMMIMDVLETEEYFSQTGYADIPWNSLEKDLGFKLAAESPLMDIVEHTLKQSDALDKYHIDTAGIHVEFNFFHCSAVQADRPTTPQPQM